MSSTSSIALASLQRPQSPSITSTPTSSRPFSDAATPSLSKPATPRPSSKSLTQEEVDAKPWKYIGHYGYSRFLASDNDFCNFRRFERLNARVILALQDEITEIEVSLDEIDRAYSKRDGPDINNGSLWT